MEPIASLYIDGQETSPTLFIDPGMNLSSGRIGMMRHDFVATVDASSMIAFLRPAYDSWVRDSREDDALMGSPQDELAEAGYPTLEALLHLPALLTTVLGSYLLEAVTSKLFGDGSTPIEYWLDEVTECRHEQGKIRFSGICYGEKR